jgi:hypothetical protein
MSNLSDKEIDRLSREAADSYEPDTSSLSWTRLEQKLIEQMPERPPDGFRFGRINPYLWGPAVVLLAGISFYFIKNYIYSQHSTRTSEQASQNSTKPIGDSSRSSARVIYTDSLSSAQNATASGTKNANLPEQPVAALSQGGAAKSSQAESGGLANDAHQVGITPANPTATTAGKNSTRNGRGSKIITPSVALATGSLASNGNAVQIGSASRQTKTTGLLNNPGASASDAFTSGVILSGATMSAAANAQTAAVTREAYIHDLPQLAYSGAGLGKVKGNDSLLNKTAQSKAPAPQKSVHINRSLSIGFTFGADYTDAGGIPNNQFSNNIGITLGYYLTSKLSVSTGILYSNKFYWSPGHGPDRPAYSQGGYGNPTTFAYSPDIEYVNGACNMYELPLTLRYDFAKNDRTKFFVNAGVSSYFMLKQTYIYFFHSGGRPLAWKSNEEAQSNYWFGVGDLSFGLETDIGKGFSFQAEPFFRIPFQKMGVENLKMYSYGFMLSFRYAPVLSRSKK